MRNLSLTLVFQAALIGLGFHTAAAACDPYFAFKDQYVVERGSTHMGKGVIRLKPSNADGCYELQQTAKPHFLLRWLSGPAVQTSEFCVQPNGELRSYSYEQHRTGVGSDGENYSLEFDWENRSVRGGRFGELPIEEGQTDPLLLQLQVRRWLCSQPDNVDLLELKPLDIHYIDKKGAGSYVFAVTAQEDVQVPAGLYSSVLVERIDSPKRKSRFWLNPKENYRLLKAEQQKKDDPIVRLSLTNK